MFSAYQNSPQERLLQQLDPVSKFEAQVRGAVPTFDRAELGGLITQWRECKASGRSNSREGLHLAVELAIRVPGVLEYAVHNRPAILQPVYQELAREIISQSSVYTATHWLGKVASAAVSLLTPGATRDQIIAITAGGEFQHEVPRRADLVQRIFSKL